MTMISGTNRKIERLPEEKWRGVRLDFTYVTGSYYDVTLRQEEGRFDLDDVADGICKKLIYRHPHVFGDVTVSGSGEVLQIGGRAPTPTVFSKPEP